MEDQVSVPPSPTASSRPLQSTDHQQGVITMSKSQNNKKNDKKKPTKTMKEKKQAKREKKDQEKSPGVSNT
jgi:hypothetical protein